MIRGVGKARRFEGAGNFLRLFAKDAGVYQPAPGLCGAGDTRGACDEDVAEKVGENDIEGPTNGKRQHIAAGRL